MKLGGCRLLSPYTTDFWRLQIFVYAEAAILMNRPPIPKMVMAVVAFLAEIVSAARTHRMIHSMMARTAALDYIGSDDCLDNIRQRSGDRCRLFALQAIRHPE
jgi:hypothetical protein